MRGRVSMALMFLVGTAALGCQAQVSVESPARVEAEYVPLYFGDDVVYFDALGLPFYDQGGTTTYVAHTDIRFEAFVAHYKDHTAAYRRWEKHARAADAERHEHAEDVAFVRRRR